MKLWNMKQEKRTQQLCKTIQVGQNIFNPCQEKKLLLLNGHKLKKKTEKKRHYSVHMVDS